MARSRNLLLIALGAFAISAIAASGAWAQAVSSEWTVEGETLPELKLKEDSVSGTGGAMSITVSGLKMTLECKKGEVKGKILEAGKDELTTTFTSCEVLKIPACKVSEPLVMETKFKMIEAGESYYADLEALKEGKPLATVVITGKECTLPAESKLTGAVAAEISLEEEAVEEKPKFSEAISSAANKALKEEGEPELKLSFGKEGAAVSGEFVPPVREQGNRRWRPAVFTRLCSERKPQCPWFSSPPLYEENTVIDIKNLFKNKFVYKIGASQLETICNLTHFEGPTSSSGAAPLPGQFTTIETLECGGGSCEVMTGPEPILFRFEATGMGWGTLTMLKASFKIACEAGTCVYKGGPMIFKVLPGGTPELESGPQSSLTKTTGSAEACSVTAKWEGLAMQSGKLRFEIAAPIPLFVTG